MKGPRPIDTVRMEMAVADSEGGCLSWPTIHVAPEETTVFCGDAALTLSFNSVRLNVKGVTVWKGKPDDVVPEARDEQQRRAM